MLNPRTVQRTQKLNVYIIPFSTHTEIKNQTHDAVN